MSTIIFKIDNQEHKRIFLNLAKTLNVKTKVLTREEEEDLAFKKAIDEGLKSKIISSEKVFEKLRKK